MNRGGHVGENPFVTLTFLARDGVGDVLEAEGGAVGRNVRYSNNANTLIDGMRELGFEPLLSNHLQAPIIVTFKIPGDPLFNFETFESLVVLSTWP